MCDWGFVESGPSVDVNSVDDIVGRLGRFSRRIEGLVLPGRSEKEATVRSERQPAEKGSESLIGIDVGILDTKAGVRIRR